MDISKQAKQMTEENGLSEQINQAYINIVGEEYATAEDVEEAYSGEFANDKEFAQDMAKQMGSINKDVVWPYTCIDWEYAAKELMYDYTEENGYYFRNI